MTVRYPTFRSEQGRERRNARTKVNIHSLVFHWYANTLYKTSQCFLIDFPVHKLPFPL